MCSDYTTVGSFIFHQTYGYGEITTVNLDCTMVFIDFRNGHCDWFNVYYLQRGNGTYLVENAFVRVIFKEGDGVKDILKRFSDYLFIDILFE